MDRNYISKRSNGATRFGAVEFAEHVERGDEADEAEAHREHHRRQNLRPRGVIRVEPQHVVVAASNADAGRVVSAIETAATHVGSGGGRTAGSHAYWSWSRGC